MRESGLQQTDDAMKFVWLNERSVLQLNRSRQQIESRGMAGQRSFEQGEVEPRDVLCNIHERVIGDCVQENISISQRQIQIDQSSRNTWFTCEHAAQIDGQTCGPNSADRTANCNYR